MSEATSSGLNFFDFDSIGSTAGLSGASGGYVSQYSYLPFGEVLKSSGAAENVFQFVGQFGVESNASGIAFMRARFCSLKEGRFISADPIGVNGADTNLYRYVFNNPITLIDPSGLGAASAAISATKMLGRTSFQPLRKLRLSLLASEQT